MVVFVSFSMFMVAFALIGIASVFRRSTTTEDYLLAGRGVGPFLTAFSSMATNNSGYAFVGLVGFAYRFGVSTIWLSIAWILGDLLVWYFVHERVRRYSEKVDARSVPAMLARDERGEDRVLAVIAGCITFLFLGVYAAAQLKAGGTALETLFDWRPETGAIVGAVIVVAYCFSGGLRASIWTDVAQAMVMIVGMLTILFLCVSQIGGPAALQSQLSALDPALGSLFPSDTALGFPLYFLGFVAGGFGAIGAPHILIRSMALTSPEDFKQTRRIYLAGFVPFVLASAVIGLYARLVVPELAQVPETLAAAEQSALLVRQAESALSAIAVNLLPQVLVGMVLAAIFAATMSTADSQILSCSAAVTQDILPGQRENYVVGKLSTLAVTGLALTVALFAGQGVFQLVLYAWSGLAVMLGPILLVRLAGLPLGRVQALAMQGAALATIIAWENGPYAAAVYNLLPGLCAAGLVYLIGNKLGAGQTNTTQQTTP